jgi:hypothetical protein
MPDSLGPIPITDPPQIAAFPFTVDWGGGLDYNPNISTHIFDAPGLKTEQRFVMGSGTPRLRVRRSTLNYIDYQKLKSHFLQAQGQYAWFTIAVAGPQGMETWNVRYENPALSIDQLAGMLTSDPGLTFLVIPDPLPAYTSVAQVTRFPDSTFEAALTGQTQHIFPLLIIQDRTRDTGGNLVNQPAYISNQRVTVDGHTYLPRLLTWSGLTQTLAESSDSVQFSFGNADDAFTSYVNQVNLYRAAVQLSLFHLESGYLCYLWGGYALQWSMDSSGRFVLPCSSGTFELTLAYPQRIITRTCWKVYRGRYCPALSTNGFSDCPKDYDSCVARGVPTSFGGVIVPPQAIRVKDSSTGVLGWGRSWMTSVTIASDTIYQNVLPEVYTNEPMPVSAMLMGGRDENDFYAALGAVSDGPIGAYNPDLVTHILDSAIPHDPLNNGGFRGIHGNDPADVNADWVQISEAQTDPSTGKITWNLPPPHSTYSAGLAFAEIRRIDAGGLQLAPLTDHSMTINVVQGVSGWVWDGPGQRRWVNGLSNCVWVAINVYLRALGLRLDQARASQIAPSVMEQYFDVNQAISAAAICDTLVDKILPITTPPTQENQFPFRGVLKERKPVKDWLTEILNCCLGYWTFVNGKLWIGIRYYAQATDAFTQAHLKWKTLQILPVKPSFNWLVVQFGDEEYQFQLNNVTIYDIDQASFVGTPDSPQYLTSTMNLVGVSNLSQAARVGITRLREEIGGLVLVNDNQQLRARNLAFSTTVLALKNQVGDVISLTHPKMPTGSGHARITSWTLNPDFSIDIQASFVTPEMYQYDVGPLVTDVKPPPLPNERPASALGLTWMPNLLGPQIDGTGHSLDPLYPDGNERTFALWQDYFIAADGSWSPAVFVSGHLNINTFIAITAPTITSVAISSGGSLAGGQTYYFGITVRDASGAVAAPSNLAAIWIPATFSNQQITVGMSPPISGTWSTWDIYAGLDRRSIARQTYGTFPMPANYVFGGPVHVNTEAMPDRSAQYVQIGVKHVIHAGIAGVLVNSVPGNNSIQSNDFIGSTDNWIGRYVSAIADQATGYAPLLNYTVTTFDPATGTLTVDPPCVVSGDPNHTVEVNDVLIVRSIVSSISTDGLTVTDPMWNNSVGKSQSGNDPTFAGLDINAEVGNVARILHGAGRGQYSKIVANDHTSITLANPFANVDTTSIVIIEEPNWADVGMSSPLAVGTDKQIVQVRIPVNNLANTVALVAGFLNDANGHLTDEQFAIFRELFIFGQPPGARTIGPGAGPWEALQTDQTIRVANENNDVTINLPPLADYAGRTLLIFSNGANNVIINAYLSSDGKVQETFFDGSTSQTITGVGATIRITSTGEYDLAVRRKRMRALRK